MEKNLDYYLSLPYRVEVTPDTKEGGYQDKRINCYENITCCRYSSNAIRCGKLKSIIFHSRERRTISRYRRVRYNASVIAETTMKFRLFCR